MAITITWFLVIENVSWIWMRITWFNMLRLEPLFATSQAALIEKIKYNKIKNTTHLKS